MAENSKTFLEMYRERAISVLGLGGYKSFVEPLILEIETLGKRVEMSVAETVVARRQRDEAMRQLIEEKEKHREPLAHRGYMS